MSYSSEVLADAPTHYWKLWDASGATAVDSSGNSRDATYVGSPTLHATSPLDVDASAFAATLNGTSQYISRAAEATINSAPWCFEIIAKINSGAATFRVIASTRDENTNNGWLLYLNDSNKLDLRHGGTGTVILQAGTVSVGSTVHVVVGHNGTKFFMYVNSVLEATNPTIAYVASTTALNIGRRTDNSFFAPITIQHAAHYGSMLSGARVSAHYAAATTIAPATGSGSTTVAAVPSLATQTIIDARGTSFALVPNSIGNIIASAATSLSLTPAIISQALAATGIINFILTPTLGVAGVVVAQAPETDSAFAVTHLRTYHLGQALEVDQALSGVNIGVALEDDLGQAVTRKKTKTATQSAETDFAQAIHSSKTFHLPLIIEPDLSQTATPNKIVHVSQATSAELAQAVAHSRTLHVGQASEADLAQPLTGHKVFHILQATETDLAQAVTHRRTRHAGQALEIEFAIPLPQFIDVGQSVETDVGPHATVVRGFNVTQALEVDSTSSFAFTRGHTYRVREGQEFDHSPHANPKKTEHHGIVKRVSIAYEKSYSRHVNVE